MFRLCALGALCAVAASGCSGDTGSGAAGSCAMVVKFRGQTYFGNGVQVVPRPGKLLGVGIVPGCNDGEAVASSHIHLATIPGVPARIALQPAGLNDYVLVSRFHGLPPAVTRLFHAPTCRSADAPINLRGPWGGILRPDGKTELTMIPPYNVNLLVRESSTPRYARAFLTVRVPASLGRPLDEHDIHVSLWKQGDISATVSCSGGRYVATAVSASPGRGST
jgi:hypothetical protein